MAEVLEKRLSVTSMARPKYFFWIFVTLIFLYAVLFCSVYESHSGQVISFTLEEENTYLIRNRGCRIPNIDPFHQSVLKFYKKKPSPFNACHEESYLRVKGDKIYLNTQKVLKDFGDISVYCQYKPIIRDPMKSSDRADFEFGFGVPKSLEFGIRQSDEFLKVECFQKGSNTSLFVDYVAVVLLKQETEVRCDKAASKRISAEPLNVIMIAIDSVSKLNFLRHFPITYSFLKDTLKPFEFHGYTKVGDNTFPNMVPMLTGHFVSYYRQDKEIGTTYYDDLDLIWKEFSSLGYRTFFIEDTPSSGTFSYLKRGFQYRPTDYYLRPFALAVEATKWRAKSGYYCFGHTSETEYFYGYLKRFVSTMKRRPFFAFTFISRTTHDDLNTAGFADQPTYDVLRDLYLSNVFNRSVLFIFSDHGIRFGDIRKTYVGKIEERMPFMFQRYPEWFLAKYPDIKKNLVVNQKRLTTHFDVHKTLQDIVSFSSKSGTDEFKKKNPGFGLSLFREIPPGRTCNDSHIMPHWCTCHRHFKLPNRDSHVIQLAQDMIRQINLWTNISYEASPCVELKLDDIVDAYVSLPTTIAHSSGLLFGSILGTLENPQQMDILDYLITIKAFPSGAIFEGTFRHYKGKLMNSGEISRINEYGNQSWCVDIQRLKKFCFCKKPLEKK